MDPFEGRGERGEGQAVRERRVTAGAGRQRPQGGRRQRRDRAVVLYEHRGLLLRPEGALRPVHVSADWNAASVGPHLHWRKCQIHRPGSATRGIDYRFQTRCPIVPSSLRLRVDEPPAFRSARDLAGGFFVGLESRKPGTGHDDRTMPRRDLAVSTGPWTRIQQEFQVASGTVKWFN